MSDITFEKIRDVKTPEVATWGSAGIDFFIPNDFNNGLKLTLGPGDDIKIPSGLKLRIPDHRVLILFNKSGIATNAKLSVGACVIDSDYRGEMHLHLINTGKGYTRIYPGQKIVQGILQQYVRPILKEGVVEDDTHRGGFGSTGLF